MVNYQHILVVIEDGKDDQEALRRAVYLVKKNGGKVTAYLTIYDFTHDVTTLLSQDERMAMRQSAIEQRADWVKNLARHYISAGIPLDIKVVWDNKPHKAILEEIHNNHYDLLIKEAHQPDVLSSIIFTPLDWHLLRKCPCDIWMVKDRPWTPGSKALVAVSLSKDEDYYEELNEKLVNKSLALAEKLDNTEVQLVGAYPEAAMSIAVELPEFTPSLYENAIRGQYLIAMKALRQKFSIGEERTHVIQGLPDVVLPKVAEELNAGIMVLGTVGRTGFSAAFIGNTVERVVGNLKCDLLAVKPDNFGKFDPEDEHDDED